MASHLFVKSSDDLEGPTRSGPSPPLWIHFLTLDLLLTPPEPHCPLAVSYTCQVHSLSMSHFSPGCLEPFSSRHSGGLFLTPLGPCSNVTCISRDSQLSQITPCPQPCSTPCFLWLSLYLICLHGKLINSLISQEWKCYKSRDLVKFTAKSQVPDTQQVFNKYSLNE